MRLIKIGMVALVIVLLAAGVSCAAGQKTGSQTQVTASRGDISQKINATGKTGYAVDAKLAFSATGKIEALNVKKGDSVKQGALLAKLETSNLELALSQAKVTEGAAGLALGDAQLAVTQAQTGVSQAEQNVTQAESAQTQAESALTLAQFNLDRLQAVGDIKDKIMKLEMLLSAAEMNRRQAGASQDGESFSSFSLYLTQLRQELASRNRDLQILLAKDEFSGVAPYELMVYDPVNQVFTLGGQKYNRLIVEDIQMKQQQVVMAEQSIEMAKQNVQKARQNVTQARQNADRSVQALEQAKLSLEQASKSVAFTQKQLDSTVITAPFDGVIADLPVNQNDYVVTPGLSAGTPVYMVKPESLEITAEVDEMDIAAIQAGQKATIVMDAVSGQTVEGQVISISLMPLLKPMYSGLVVYEVKIRFVNGPPSWAKSGMSAAIDILTLEKKGVIVVPTKAVGTDSQGQKSVNVLVNGKTEVKPVSVGLNGGTQSEIISGINEGEVVLVNP